MHGTRYKSPYENVLGTAGPDTILGSAADDLLDGGPGADLMIGGPGDDVYVVDDVGDAVVELFGEGLDLVLTSISFTLPTGSSVEVIAARDQHGTNPLNLYGNDLDNRMVGNQGPNLLSGGYGAEFTTADTMIGLGGDDVYVVDHTRDCVIEAEQEGWDTIFTSSSFALEGGSEVEVLSALVQASRANLDLRGNEFSNRLFGTYGANLLDGGGGADLMVGLDGDDFYVVDHMGDIVIEETDGGVDLVFTTVSWSVTSDVETLSTRLHSGADPIDLTGNSLSQTLYGNNGANVLDGGGGSDTLHGFAGSDTFVFTSALRAGNVDTIADLDSGDRIALDDNVFAGLTLGALGADAFTTAAAATATPHRIVYDAATGALYFDADGNGAGIAVQFAQLSPGLALTSDYFVVI